MKKTAIVTGGSRGIGYAIAKQLGLDGCQVVIMATGEQKTYQEALDGLTGLGIDWYYVRGSIDDQESTACAGNCGTFRQDRYSG